MVHESVRVAAFQLAVGVGVHVPRGGGRIAKGVEHDDQVSPAVVVVAASLAFLDDPVVVFLHIVGRPAHVDRRRSEGQPVDAVDAVDVAGEPGPKAPLPPQHMPKATLG